MPDSWKPTDEQTDKAYYVGTCSWTFRPGKLAEILGVVWFTPKEKERPPRACFHLRYADGKEDLSIPIADTANYIIQGPDIQKRNPWKERDAESS